MTDVAIDRLVLDIPGFDPAQGQALALGIANALSRDAKPGEHAHAVVTLDRPDALPTAQLAARIAAALRQQFG